MLILLFKINSTKQYVVTKDQFVNGFRSLNCSNLKDIKALLPQLRNEFNQPNSKLFKEVYNFAYDYNKEPDQKSFAFEDAAATWQLFFNGKYGHIDQWTEFITQKYARPIPRDTWKQFLNFVLDIGTDLSKYADDGSWPSIIDDYVETLKAN
jgi:DCN1-like protein 1/2